MTTISKDFFTSRRDDFQAKRPDVYDLFDEPYASFAFARKISVFPDQLENYFEDQLKRFQEFQLPVILENSLKTQSTNVSKLKKYSLIPLYAKGDYHRGVPVQDWHYRKIGLKSYSLYLDANTAFALCFEGVPQIIFGFERTGISICRFEQIQLVHPFVEQGNGEFKRPEPRALFRFDINKLKVCITEEWSMFNACYNIMVVHSSSNRAVLDNTSTLTAQKATKMYDTAFKDKKYNLRSFNEKFYWVRNLSEDLESIYMLSN